MIRVDTRALLALYDRRLDVAAGAGAANTEEGAVTGVRAIARVEAILADGQFRASIANQSLTLALPPGTRVGDQIAMRLIDGAWTPAPVGTAPVAPHPPLARQAPPLALESAATTRLSPAVRLLAELLPQNAATGSRPAIGGATALLSQAPQDPSALAQAIHRAVGESGLFYEAHQAEWLTGMRSLNALRAEPQGRLTPLPSEAAPRSMAPPIASQAALNAPPQSALATAGAVPGAGVPPPGAVAAGEYQAVAALTGGEEALPAALVLPAEGESATTPPPSGDAAAKAAPSLVHPDALPLVRQQLEVLEQPVLAWRGDFWPGQPGEIELREDRDAADEPGAPRSFATRLTLELPRLGPVEAVLQISGKKLQVRVRGEDRAAAQEMGATLDQLGSALRALGLDLEELRVAHGQS